MPFLMSRLALLTIALATATLATPATAQDRRDGGKLLLTDGVTSVEGRGGRRVCHLGGDRGTRDRGRHRRDRACDLYRATPIST